MMKAQPPQTRAFTRTELVAVLAVLGLFTTLFVHAQLDPQEKAKRDRIMCVSQLKQVGLAFRLWSNDNNDKFPMQVEAKRGGSKEAIQAGERT